MDAKTYLEKRKQEDTTARFTNWAMCLFVLALTLATLVVFQAVGWMDIGNVIRTAITG